MSYVIEFYDHESLNLQIVNVLTPYELSFYLKNDPILAVQIPNPRIQSRLHRVMFWGTCCMYASPYSSFL